MKDAGLILWGLGSGESIIVTTNARTYLPVSWLNYWQALTSLLLGETGCLKFCYVLFDYNILNEQSTPRYIYKQVLGMVNPRNDNLEIIGIFQIL